MECFSKYSKFLIFHKNSSDVHASVTVLESCSVLKFWEPSQNRYLKKSKTHQLQLTQTSIQCITDSDMETPSLKKIMLMVERVVTYLFSASSSKNTSLIILTVTSEWVSAHVWSSVVHLVFYFDLINIIVIILSI